MQAYTTFATVYDELMDNVPYEEWGTYIHGLLLKNHVSKGVIADLGCGTGKITRFLANKGYEMIGVDYSVDMLSIAREHTTDEIMYVNQDMSQLDLGEEMDAIVSICDSLNYLTEEELIKDTFKRVFDHLKENGCFIFDLNTEYKFKEILGENTFAENREEVSFIWDNFYDEEEKINEYDLTLFLKGEDGRFDRFQEFHYEKAYDLESIKQWLEEAGFTSIQCFNAFTDQEPKSDSERVYCIAKKTV